MTTTAPSTTTLRTCTVCKRVGAGFFLSGKGKIMIRCKHCGTRWKEGGTLVEAWDNFEDGVGVSSFSGGRVNS